MNGYETIYKPTTGSKAGLKAHDCRPKRNVYWTREIEGLATPSGSIVCCDKCGQHWYLHIGGGWGSDLHTAMWYKVRWYHYGMKRRILGIN